MNAVAATHWKDLLSRRYETPGTPIGTHYFSQRLGALISALAFRLGASPNHLTLAGMLLVFLGCWVFALDSVFAWVAACIIWQVSFAFDCADGQLARATGKANPFGAWLDLACDHVREVLFGFTVFYVFLQSEMPLFAAMAAGIILASGNLVYLQTASTLRTHDYQGLQFRSSLGWAIRFLLRSLLDMPIYLLLLLLFRGMPELLFLYVVFHGLMQMARATALARRRIAA